MGLDRELAGYEDLLDRFTAVQTTHDAGGLAEALLDRWLSRNSRKSQSSAGTGGKNGAPQSGPGSGASPNGGQGSDNGSTPNQGSADADDAADSADGDARSGDPNGNQEPGTQANAPEPSGSDSSPGTGQSKGRSRGKDQTDATADGDRKRARKPHPFIANRPAQRRHADRRGPGRGDRESGRPDDQLVRVPGLHQAARPDRRRWPRPTMRRCSSCWRPAADVVRRLRRGLANALRSAEKRWWRDDQVRGSLSPRTLYRLCTDRRLLDVFRIRSTVQGRSTAVCVVLDASGSMTIPQDGSGPAGRAGAAGGSGRSEDRHRGVHLHDRRPVQPGRGLQAQRPGRIPRFRPGSAASATWRSG